MSKSIRQSTRRNISKSKSIRQSARLRESLPLVVSLLFLSSVFGKSPEHQDFKHILVENGKINCEVVVPDEAGTMAYFAGQELQKFLSQSFGSEVALVKHPDADKVSIILGNNRIVEELGVDFSAIPRDGFVIQSSGSSVFIAGNDGMDVNVEKAMKTSRWFMRDTHPQRGTLYGAYEFLERFLGVRFYFPGRIGTIVPQHSDLTIPEIDLAISPDHTARTTSYTGKLFEGYEEECLGKNAAQKEWYYKTLHLLRLRFQTKYIPHCHGLSRHGYIERFGESHPEYFALMSNGQRHNNPGMSHAGHLCFSSGIREEIYKDAEAYLTGKPAESRSVTPRGRGRYYWSTSSCQPGYFDIMPQDGFYPCNCPECQKHFRGLSYRDMDKKASSEFMWNFFCEVADKLTANKIPGYVTTMAYPPYRDIPTRDIPKNVMVSLCPVGPDGREFDETLEYIKSWVNKLDGRKVWLWNNIGKYSRLAIPGVPLMVPKATGKYYKAVAPYIYGAYVTLAPDYYLFKYMDAYVAHKVMWNHSTDVDKLLDEHYRLMFGAAAATMETVYDRFEDVWVNEIRGNTIETALGETAIPPSEEKLWNEIYSKAEIARLNGLFDQAEQETADDVASLERVQFMRKNLFGPLVQERDEYNKRLRMIDDFSFHAVKLDTGETVTIDGMLDEAVWDNAQELHLRKFPEDAGGSEAVKTVVKVLRDDRNLYFAFRCEDPNMADELSVVPEKNAADVFRGSSVEIFLNPTGDRKNYFQFAVSPGGGFADVSGRKLESSQDLDMDWQSDALYAVKKDADGWSVELAMPLKNLAPYDDQGFPVNFCRSRLVRGSPHALYTWSPYIRRGFHEIENFGTLKFDEIASENLIDNSDFTAEPEKHSAGQWRMIHRDRNNPTDGWMIDCEHFISGGCSLLLTNESVVVRQSMPALKPDTKYLLNFFLKMDEVVPKINTPGCGVRFSIWDQRNNYMPVNSYTGTMPWTKQGFVYKTSSEINVKSKSYIHFSMFRATGKAWFDKITLHEIEE